jgi:hypothetical protein
VPTRKPIPLGLISIFSASVAVGSEAIPNWPAPAAWSPPKARGVMALSELPPVPFIAVTPCRVADTRGNGFTGTYGPPSLVANATRNFTITGQCGIPAGAAAVSFNFGALNVGGAGDLRVFPAGGGVPLVSTLNYNASTPNIANGAVVPLGTGGAITVQADAVAIDLIIDLNGYYASAAANQGNTFKVVNSGGTGVPAIWGETHSSSLQAAGIYGLALSATGINFGVWGQNYSDSDDSIAVLGNSFGSTGKTFGVFGNTSSTGTNSAGVFGQAYGTSGLTYGVWGLTGSTADGAAGVYGQAYGASGRTYGVYGVTSSTGGGAVGVYGVNGSDPGDVLTAGVRGASTLHAGVAGVSGLLGVYGAFLSTAGAVLTDGRLGADSTYGVYATGSIGATGAKPFIEPHPNDPTKEIAYVALEGPEAGTYFRGRGRIHNGTGVIPVPESFRLVSDEEGLTVQITPIGQIANVAVHAADLNTVVVRSSTKELEFYYLVNGVRKAFKDWEVITENKHYVPEGPTARMPGAFAPEQRRALIATGIYNEDGTVNMATAERLGWAKIWADREALARTKARDAAKAPVSQK